MLRDNPPFAEAHLFFGLPFAEAHRSPIPRGNRPPSSSNFAIFVMVSIDLAVLSGLVGSCRMKSWIFKDFQDGLMNLTKKEISRIKFACNESGFFN